MGAKKTELERLLELKKLQEIHQVLDKEFMQERMKLEMKYKEYIYLTSIEMEQELNKIPLTKIYVQSEDMNPILADYKKRYSNESWYQEPVTKNGRTELGFPSVHEMGDFFQAQSAANRSFVVVDKETNKVMAYSNGDGKMYHGDGKEFKPGDTPTPCGVELDKFSMPERENQSAISP